MATLTLPPPPPPGSSPAQYAAWQQQVVKIQQQAAASGAALTIASPTATTPTATTPTPTTPATPTTPTTPSMNQNAYQSALGLLRAVGLESLGPTLLGILQQGYTDGGAIQAQLEQTQAWKDRFAGNEQRLKNGLNVLPVDQYLSAENAYKAILRNAGLPAGFYDGKDAIDNWIGNGVAPEELGRRVGAAAAMVQQVDPNTRAAFRNYYGVDDGHLMAYFLDPKKGEQILNQQAAAAQIGAAALDQGLKLTDASRALDYAQHGVDANAAAKAYGDIAALLPEESAIAGRFGQTYTQTDAEDELLGGLASAQRKRKQLNRNEQALFERGGGAGDSVYNPSYGLGRETSGQF